MAAARAMGVVASAAVAVAAAEGDSVQVKKARHLQVVPERESARINLRKPRAVGLAVATVVLAVAFGLVYLHVVMAQRQFALDRLTTKVQAEQANYQKLRLEVAQLGSPAQIISTAEGKLGMRQPASVTYLTPTATIGGTPDPSRSHAASDAVHAPAGDADWPQIKAQLAGGP